MSDSPGKPAPIADSRLNRRVIGISVGAALGGFLFGFDSSVINGAVDSIRDEFGLDNDTFAGFVVAAALLGCAVGAWFAGGLANKYGRIRVMVIAAILFFISAFGSGFAFGVWDLVAWRIIGGLAIGAASVIAPAYIAEVSPSKFRGRLGSLQQLAIVLGIFAALLSDQLLQQSAGGASEDLWFGQEAWRWMFIVAAVPALIYGFAALKLPESPRYLVGKGRDDEAAKVLREFSGEHDVQHKIDDIKATINTEEQQSLRDLKGSALGLKPIVWTGILLSVFQQFVGINVIFYYSTTLWQSVGFDASDAFLTSTITSVTNIVVTIVAILLVDKIGRRRLLLIGSTGMFISLGLMAVAFSNASGSGDSVSFSGSWDTVAVVGANAFVVFFGATWGPVVWVLLGEMFPNKIRASALAVAAAAQWIANFAITMSFPVFADIGLTFAYGFYAVMALLSLLFVYFRVPETKGMELEAMDSDAKVKRGHFVAETMGEAAGKA
ncbi:sugar porter (SP) family MFS transporter [Sediminihabitans luteus]|uniref:Sugar porter (SP) family MFS transporter n=1 Tax=Sediminihabitans luteus TaxID=1138585 RepID=A0A2M9CC14_9CELL|nr:sugar porter family MFS transporter [Sediminihabitans luteus]PJJ68619.1 sugar porter (SP) family MFS transporter [Sediminihabitans luteus]GII99958.1 MFS transporter [Sediminihabitans luteus]